MSNPYTEWLEDKHRANNIYQQIVDLFMEFHWNFAIQNRISYDELEDGIIILAIAYSDWEREIAITHHNNWYECAKFCYDELEWYKQDDCDCFDNVEEMIGELKEQMIELFKEANKYE